MGALRHSPGYSSASYVLQHRYLQRGRALGFRWQPQTIAGREELIDAFQKTMEVTKEQGIAFAPADAVVPWRLFYSFYGQLGGEVLSPDATEVVLDQEKAEEALSFLVELTVDKKFTPSNQNYDAAVAQFQSGNAGFHWNGEWEVTTFLDARCPSAWSSSQTCSATSTFRPTATFVIPKGVANDHAAFDAALQFVSSMLKSSMIWAEGGHIPAYRSVLESAEYKNLKPQSNYAGVDEVVLDPKAWFSGSGSDMGSGIGADATGHGRHYPAKRGSRADTSRDAGTRRHAQTLLAKARG